MLNLLEEFQSLHQFEIVDKALIPTQLEELRMIFVPARDVAPTELEELSSTQLEQLSSDLDRGDEFQPSSMRQTPTWIEEMNSDLIQGIEDIELWVSLRKKSSHSTFGEAMKRLQLVTATHRSSTPSDYLKNILKGHSSGMKPLRMKVSCVLPGP